MKELTERYVLRHMAYLQSLPDSKSELDKFETLYDHMFYYFVNEIGLGETEAEWYVKDFHPAYVRRS